MLWRGHFVVNECSSGEWMVGVQETKRSYGERGTYPHPVSFNPAPSTSLELHPLAPDEGSGPKYVPKTAILQMVLCSAYSDAKLYLLKINIWLVLPLEIKYSSCLIAEQCKMSAARTLTWHLASFPFPELYWPAPKITGPLSVLPNLFCKWKINPSKISPNSPFNNFSTSKSDL